MPSCRSLKTILDRIVTFHDQFLTKKMREVTNAFEQHYRQVQRQSRRDFAALIATGGHPQRGECPPRQLPPPLTPHAVWGA